MMGHFLVAASLLLVHLDNVVLLHLQGLGGLIIIDAASVKEESIIMMKLVNSLFQTNI